MQGSLDTFWSLDTGSGFEEKASFPISPLIGDSPRDPPDGVNLLHVYWFSENRKFVFEALAWFVGPVGSLVTWWRLGISRPLRPGGRLDAAASCFPERLPACGPACLGSPGHCP